MKEYPIAEDCTAPPLLKPLPEEEWFSEHLAISIKTEQGKQEDEDKNGN